LVLFRGSRVFFAIICVFVRIVRSGGLVFLSKGADGGDGTGDGESEGGGVEPCGGGKGAGEAWHGHARKVRTLREGVPGERHAYTGALARQQALRGGFRLPVLSRGGLGGASHHR